MSGTYFVEPVGKPKGKDSNAKRQQAKPLFASLENVSPELFLATIFHPILLATKCIGVLPIYIVRDAKHMGPEGYSVGSAYFRRFTSKTAVSLFLLSGLAATTASVAPFFLDTALNAEIPFMELIALVAFTSAQFLAASLTTVMIPWMTSRLCAIWNGLHQVMTNLGRSGIIPCSGFQLTYILSLTTILFWVCFTIGYCVFNAIIYYDRLAGYYGGKVQAVNFCIFMLFTALISTHVIHSMIFGTICCAIVQSFGALSKLAKQGGGVNESTAYGAGELNKFTKFLETYEQLAGLVHHLSSTYGAYFLVQLVGFIVCVLSNVLAIVADHHEPKILLAHIASILSYIVWLFAIGSTGEMVYKATCKCRDSLRIASLQFKIPGRVVYMKLGDTPLFITALGFFNINRRLIANVLGTLTTYLVVLLQFRISSE